MLGTAAAHAQPPCCFSDPTPSKAARNSGGGPGSGRPSESSLVVMERYILVVSNVDLYCLCLTRGRSTPERDSFNTPRLHPSSDPRSNNERNELMISLLNEHG